MIKRRGKRWDTGDGRWEKRDERRESRGKGREMRDKRQETRDERGETRDGDVVGVTKGTPQSLKMLGIHDISHNKSCVGF